MNTINTLIVGATGATGRLLVEELLNRGHRVKVIVRSAARLPEAVANHPNLTVIEDSLLDLNDAELTQHLEGVDAVASCLGHNLTFKGIYGHPRRLVTDATRRLCEAIKRNKQVKPIKFVLMNTTGNRNHDLNEQISFVEKVVVGLIRLLVPPHPDNEQAADYLRVQIGQQDKRIGWVVVRPDGLTDETAVSEYDTYPSPVVSAIFGSGKTSRINVAHFMAEVMTSDASWNRWKGQMPVIYNRESVSEQVGDYSFSS